MAVDPQYYVAQMVFFAWGATLLGFLVRQFQLERQIHSDQNLKGWAICTPRSVFLGLLVLSSFIFVVVNFDPRSVLGIYSPVTMKFLETFAVICMFQAIGQLLYLYLTVLFQQNLAPVPTPVQRIWITVNVVFFACETLSLVVMAATDNFFYTGVNACFFVVHEIVIDVVLNVSLCKLSRGLIQSTVNPNISADSFKNTIRKIRTVQIATTLLLMGTIVYQLVGGIERLLHYGEKVPPSPETFPISSVVGPFLVCSGHSLCLFASRRPTTKPLSLSQMSNGRLSRTSSGRMSRTSSGRMSSARLSAMDSPPLKPASPNRPTVDSPPLRSSSPTGRSIDSSRSSASTDRPAFDSPLPIIRSVSPSDRISIVITKIQASY